MKTLKLTWPTALHMVLLNLRVTPFRKYKLAPFNIVTGKTLHLALVAFNAQLIKEDSLYFLKGLIKVTNKNHAIFSQHAPKRQQIKCHKLQPGNFVY